MVNTMQFSLYGIFFLSAFVLGFLVAGHGMRKRGVPGHIILCSYLLNTAIILYLAVFFGVLASGFQKNFLNAGFSSMGGAIGLIIGSKIMTMIDKKDGKAIWENYMCALPLLYGVAKLGCFSIGCCAGIPYEGFFSITYDNYLYHTEPLFSVQLAESFLFIGIFFFVNYLYQKQRTKKLISIIMILCGLGKFSLDFLRSEHIGKFLSINQMVCLIMIGIGIINYVRKKEE